MGLVFPFLDTDVYKWLEAVGWELGHGPDPDLSAAADEVIGLIQAAQRPDGYVNTYVQVVDGGRPYRDLQWGHELYCVGHLVQAAIAWHRSLGDDRLLEIALRAVASVDAELGPDGRDGIDGHPEVEMALVELYRTTGDRRHLELARRMVELRGHGLLGPGRFGAAYWQDRLPVRDAPTVEGHAVRQLYLDSGVVDLAVELGDRDLLEAVARRWHDMVATRSYLTGGLGSRQHDEAFGDPYELPPDLAYAETCAAIASVMLAWRLLLATGDPACADVIERTIYNGVLPGVSRWRDRLLLRQHAPAPDGPGGDPGRVRGTPAVVRLRLLPAERHAPAQLLGAVPRDGRRLADPAAPVRRRGARRRCRRRSGPAPGRHRLSVGRRDHGLRPRDAGDAMDAVVADPGLVRVGERRRRGGRARDGAGRRPDGRADALLDGRRPRSCSASTCRSG